MNFKLYAILLLVFLFSMCTNEPQEEPVKEESISHLGEVNIKVSGNETAQVYFKEGLLLLHSFEYEDARATFLKAQSADPAMGMAYWGEAMTYNHSLWQRQELKNGLEALEKFGKDKEVRLSKLKLDIEKDFFEAIEKLYVGGTKYDRDLAYSEHMETLVKKYPDQHEVAAFYAISLLGASRNGRDQKLYDKAATIAKSIMLENPNHPGALHYMIHSYDDPDHAHLAKEAADSYSQVAPDAAHALHMPSHIYVALGDWDNVVRSNIASWNASLKRKERKELGSKALNYHALNWLQYGLLQKGKLDEANLLLERMKGFAEVDDRPVAASYLVSMNGAQMVETKSWDKVDVNTENLNLIKKANCLYLNGMNALKNSDSNGLEKYIEEINKEWQVAKDLVGESGFAMCSSGGFANKPPNQLDVDMVKVMELQLKAMQAKQKVDYVMAEKYLIEAVALDEKLSYSYGPPSILKPVAEDLAELLLEQGKYQEAALVFDQALKRNPNRLASLKGKLNALKKSNQGGIASLESQIQEQLKHRAGEAVM